MNIFESFLCDGVNGFADGVEECSPSRRCEGDFQDID